MPSDYCDLAVCSCRVTVFNYKVTVNAIRLLWFSSMLL